MSSLETAAIQASRLGKLYHIGADPKPKLFHRLLGALTSRHDTRPLWALRDIDLEIQRGERLGVIGPNGSGKTTLLLLLAGLLEPTEGSVQVRGRISTLFDINSGLYSHLSVLDNLRIAAALFGMTRSEYEERLATIVDFGELKPYLYARLGELSVGYQARVSFVTALHSDIDILLADEVFAVGDLAFAEKCFLRIEELCARGTTVVLVSHGMELIRQFCTRACYLSQGRIRAEGVVEKVIEAYLEDCQSSQRAVRS